MNSMFPLFVGCSDDPRYPEIISGPFDHIPKMPENLHTLWNKNPDGSWVRNLEAEAKAVRFKPRGLGSEKRV